MKVSQQLSRQTFDEWVIDESNQCRIALLQLLLIRLIHEAVLSLHEVHDIKATEMLWRMVHGAENLEESYKILEEYLKQWNEDELPKILKSPRSVLDNLFQECAAEWAVDYKPWEENLTPQQYASHGFKQGIEYALRTKR